VVILITPGLDPQRGEVLSLKVIIGDVVNVPYETVINTLIDFIREHTAGVNGVVMGLSGGLDSSALLVLLAKALTPSRVTALILPDSRSTPGDDVEDALELARALGVNYYVAYIDKIVDSYGEVPFIESSEDLPTGNLRARIRMNIMYYYANKFNALVVGSSDRSELLIGYYTKYGDGAADILPLGCLYKTQVRELGKLLGLPAKIVYKPSAPRLWRGHTALSELGYTYEEIDLALYALFDLKMSVEEATSKAGLPRELLEKVLAMHKRSRHKRATPPVPKLPWLPQPLPEI